MARYYFHVRTGDTIDPDPDGTDLPDPGTAEKEALAAARELLANAIKRAKDDVPDCFVVADEQGRHLRTIPLGEVLPQRLRVGWRPRQMARRW